MGTLFPAAMAVLVPGFVSVLIALVGPSTRALRLTAATVGTILMLTGMSIQMRMTQAIAPIEIAASATEPDTPAFPGSVDSAQAIQPVSKGPRRMSPARELTTRRSAGRLAMRPPSDHKNEIRDLEAESPSGQELHINVSYRYAGDYGEQEVFLHAAALQSDDWRSRVPWTSFPGVAVGVGEGSAALSIIKVPDTGPSTSAFVRVCLVSLRNRSAFLCRNFEYTKAWE